MSLKPEIKSHSKFEMLYHKLIQINISVPGLRLWRSDTIDFYLPYSQIADL